MLTKILAGVFVLVMLGAVVMGAITLFTDRSGADAHLGYNTARRGAVAAPEASNGRGGQGPGQGRGRENRETDRPSSPVPETTPQDSIGGGQGYGRGQGASREDSIADVVQETIEGVVLETSELVIETDSGRTVQVGLGPSHYRDDKGFILNTGDHVQVSGYWEGDEFKAAQVTNLDTGAQIILRDASGRPMWAGQGRGQNRG